MPTKPAKLPTDSKNMKKRSRKIRVCPSCLEPTLRSADSISGWMTEEIFKCDKCGYRGTVFIEVDPDEFEKFKESQLKAEKNKSKNET